MASITMEMGSFSHTMNISDARFLELATLVVDNGRNEGDEIGGDPQEQLEYFLKNTTSLIQKDAAKIRDKQLKTEGRETLENEFDEPFVE